MAGLHAEMRVNGETSARVDDVMRGAAVLQVAAMDAYFTRKFIDLLIPYLKKHGPNQRLVKMLSEAGLDTAQALQMATMKRPFRRIRTLITAHLDTYTTQRFRAIDELFVCFGVKELSKNAAASTHQKQLLRRVEMLVERRHAIVHAGDALKGGKLRAVKSKQLLTRITAVLTFVKAADALLAKAVKI